VQVNGEKKLFDILAVKSAAWSWLIFDNHKPTFQKVIIRGLSGWKIAGLPRFSGFGDT